MVRIDLLMSKETFKKGKFDFTAGALYFSRLSKNGNQILVMDDNGKWCSFTNQGYTLYWKMLKNFHDKFEWKHSKLVRNYAEVKKITG